MDILCGTIPKNKTIVKLSKFKRVQIITGA